MHPLGVKKFWDSHYPSQTADYNPRPPAHFEPCPPHRVADLRRRSPQKNSGNESILPFYTTKGVNSFKVGCRLQNPRPCLCRLIRRSDEQWSNPICRLLQNDEPGMEISGGNFRRLQPARAYEFLRTSKGFSFSSGVSEQYLCSIVVSRGFLISLVGTAIILKGSGDLVSQTITTLTRVIRRLNCSYLT